MDDKRLMEIQGLVQGLGALPSSTSPGFENHAPHRTPLEEMGLARALNANVVRRTLAGDLVVELLGAVAVGRNAVERAARAERERDEARYQVVTLQRLIDDAAAASAKELQEARADLEAQDRQLANVRARLARTERDRDAAQRMEQALRQICNDMALRDEDLAEISQVHSRATEGTWTVEPHGPLSPDGRQPLALYAGRSPRRHGLRLLNLCDGDQSFLDNVNFIAAAHQIVPSLLAEVRRLRGLLAVPTPDLRATPEPSAPSEPPEPAGWVFAPDLSRALDGKQAVGNDPLVLEVQTKISALATAERSLAEAQQHVRNLQVELAQITAERDTAQEVLDLLKPVEGDDAVDPARVLRLATEPHLDEDGEDVVDELAQAAPRLARALVALRGARQPDWVCECGLPMARNPHPDAGKPNVLLNVGATYVCIPCTVRTRHGWANQARERDLDLQRAQDEIAALRNGLITALGMRWITVRLPTGWSESRAPDDTAIIAWARQLAVQAQSMEALAGRSQTLPEIVLEGRVTSVSLQGSKRLYVRPTRTDALLVFQAASRMRRQGWECVQVRVTLRTQGGEVHLNGAAGWAAQDLISVTFGGEAADAFYAHASSIGVTIGEWAKVTWPPVDLGAPAPAAPADGSKA